MITFQDFQKIDIRIGKIISVNDFPEARKPAYKLEIDFGKEIGIKKSIGQFMKNYPKEKLINKLVACVINFPPLQMGPAKSEVLTLGFPDSDGEAIIISPSKDVPLGGKLF